MKKIVLFLGSVLLLASCDVKDPIYNTPHPNHGIVMGLTEWSQRGEGVEVPIKYRVEVSGMTNTATTTTFIMPGLFEPGNVEVLAYNLPAGVSANGGIATVSTGTDGTLLVPDAGVLFSGVATAHVIADDTTRVTLAMQQRMREVHFTLTITDGDPERITDIKARLDGVAASINLRTGEVMGNSASVMLSFLRKGDKLSANVWTIGIIEEAKQQIVTTLTFSDNHRIETTTDVTDIFHNFNADKLTPLSITGSLYAPVGTKPDGTIIDWKPGNGDGGDVDTNM
ncbi:FimB/Mfa2 family fimbrial subunit [Bacteroides sp.]|uniref:FimB/Mfa2 family fimbrial subunit n=1 Tax=Bacteroides sp. TaxID=29523 RepID=UPI002589E0D9|nr:FimB/Mfa2 family fimbrial subunit [Bacteroides sp.]